MRSRGNLQDRNDAAYSWAARCDSVHCSRVGRAQVSTRLSSWWYDLQDSLWFLPAVITGIAIALALGMVRLDEALLLDRRTGSSWLFGGGAEGARGVLSAIAGTMITVTGVVFSITIVALQLASAQFTPRILRTFTGDRGNQVVLGAFIGTFTYALLVLRSVRTASSDAVTFVPAASVTLAIVLVLVSMGLLIYYIHHVASSIRASVIIDRAARDTLGLVDELYPADSGRPTQRLSPRPLEAPGVVHTTASGYVQHIDQDALVSLVEEQGIVVRLEPLVGEFVLPGAVLASVWPTDKLDESLAQAIRVTVVLGSERTLQADVELGIRQLADVAIKSLSPGINDPTTATICIDRLGEVLVRLAHKGNPEEVHTGKDGGGNLILPRPSFARLVAVAFDQLRHYRTGDPAVAEHLVEVLGRMVSLVPPERRPPLVRQARLVLQASRDQGSIPSDLKRLDEAGAWAADGSQRAQNDLG